MLKKFIPTLKKHFKFTKKEYLDMIIITLILSFIFSLADWGKTRNYLLHLISIIIIVYAVLLAHLAIQKVFAIYNGYSSKFHISVVSLLAALMIGFLTSNPKGTFILVLVIPGTMLYKTMPKHRIGRWPKGPVFGELSLITGSGIVLNQILALTFYGLYLATNLWGFWLITIINVFFAFGTILPIPKNDGLQLLYGSRVGYVVTAILVISTSYLIFMQYSFLATLLLTIITVLVIWASYYYFVEKRYLGR
tara:strand:- start:1255 stop:2004 length:750 start_codon:yes stop_codon:yes gene_type:complete